jgi:hypothetical protein
LSAQDALTAALLLLILAALFAFTRSRWLDDWDSVNFAFGLDDFDVTKHWPHPPGYPVYIAAGKLAYSVIADHAPAHSRGRRRLDVLRLGTAELLLPVALRATHIMALSPLFWLQSGLALTDMFGMVFVVGFLLVEGWALSLIGSLGQAFGPMHLTTGHIAATRPFTTSTISSRPSSLAKSAGSPG